jgi:hypothetical protein
MSRSPVLLHAFVLGAVVATFVGGAPLHGQSLLSSAGLGLPAAAPDGRTQMLGGVGVGLSGAGFVPTDPASAGWALLPGISVSGQGGGDRAPDASTSNQARFPLVGIVYPYGSQIYSVSFSGVFSQQWDVEVERDLAFEGQRVGAIDRFRGEGGISTARFGVARRFFEDRVSVGGQIGTHLGSVSRQFSRELNVEDVGPDVEPFQVQGSWRSEGLNAAAGVNWDLSSILRVGGSVTWSEELRLAPTEGTEGAGISVPLPLEWRAGLFATLAPGLGLAASVYRADWSAAAEAMGDAAAPGSVLQWGTGLEWSRARLLGRDFPLAIGYRARDLPFSYLGEAAREQALTGGFSLHLADTETAPLARLHLGMEFGTRTSGAREEDFWRSILTLRLAGR